MHNESDYLHYVQVSTYACVCVCVGRWYQVGRQVRFIRSKIMCTVDKNNRKKKLNSEELCCMLCVYMCYGMMPSTYLKFLLLFFIYTRRRTSPCTLGEKKNLRRLSLLRSCVHTDAHRVHGVGITQYMCTAKYITATMSKSMPASFISN